MDQAGLTRRDLISFIGSRQKVSEVLAGKRDITMSMARALHIHLGIPADVLLQEPGAAFDSTFEEIEPGRFPLKEMANAVGSTNFPTSLTVPKMSSGPCWKRREASKQPPCLSFERTAIAASTPRPTPTRSGPGAGASWELPMKIRPTPTISRGTVTAQFMREVAQLSIYEDGPRRARACLADHGIVLVVERHLPRTHLDGAALRLADGRPVIGLTLRFDRIDNFWFSLMHELAHVGLHLDQGQDEPFIDDLSLKDADPLEAEADQHAQDALIPRTFGNPAPCAMKRPCWRSTISHGTSTSTRR